MIPTYNDAITGQCTVCVGVYGGKQNRSLSGGGGGGERDIAVLNLGGGGGGRDIAVLNLGGGGGGGYLQLLSSIEMME